MMSHVTTRSASFTIPHKSSPRSSTARTPVTRQPSPDALSVTRVGTSPLKKHSLTIPAELKERSRIEDAFSLVVLCGLMLIVLAGTAWMVQDFIDALVSFGSVGLVRGLVGM